MAEGKLFLVGLGPGAAELLTPAAVDALRRAEAIVGFRGYLEPLAALTGGKEVVAMELGQELERAQRAVDLAYGGRTVAVVSSGDAGVYGMAGPLFRILTAGGWDGENPPVVTIPGISALQAAAALLGSPLMQDFCAISLSDLLTPWDTIRRRLAAAALGDFVTAIYNPRSQRRDWQLLEARRLMLEQRPPATPVGLVREAYRPGQQAILTTLHDLESHAASVDMFTTVIIGNSATYIHQGKMVTPRGYEGK